MLFCYNLCILLLRFQSETLFAVQPTLYPGYDKLAVLKKKWSLWSDWGIFIICQMELAPYFKSDDWQVVFPIFHCIVQLCFYLLHSNESSSMCIAKVKTGIYSTEWSWDELQPKALPISKEVHTGDLLLCY